MAPRSPAKPARPALPAPKTTRNTRKTTEAPPYPWEAFDIYPELAELARMQWCPDGARSAPKRRWPTFALEQPGWFFPDFDINGNELPDGGNFRFVEPVLIDGDKPYRIKYTRPMGAVNRPYYPQCQMRSIKGGASVTWFEVGGNPNESLTFTEGPIKSLISSYLTGRPFIGLNGVDGANEAKTNRLSEELTEAIVFSGREVYIAFDSDVSIKPGVESAAGRLYSMLCAVGARVSMLTFPPQRGDDKPQKIDDHLFENREDPEIIDSPEFGLERTTPEKLKLMTRMRETFVFIEKDVKYQYFPASNYALCRLPEDGKDNLTDQFSIADLRNTHSGFFMTGPDGKRALVVDVYHQWPGRAGASHTKIDMLSAPRVICPEDGSLNMWRGFPAEPRRDDALLRKFRALWDAVCPPTPDDPLTSTVDPSVTWTPYELMMDMLRMHIHGIRPEILFLVVGTPGTGKSLVLGLLKCIYGRHYVTDKPEAVFGDESRFNIRTAEALLIDIPEMKLEPSHVGSLNALLTDEIITAEEKNVSKRDVVNRSMFVASTNFASQVHIEPNDRRIVVVNAALSKDDTTTERQWAIDLITGRKDGKLYDEEGIAVKLTSEEKRNAERGMRALCGALLWELTKRPYKGKPEALRGQAPRSSAALLVMQGSESGIVPLMCAEVENLIRDNKDVVVMRVVTFKALIRKAYEREHGESRAEKSFDRAFRNGMTNLVAQTRGLISELTAAGGKPYKVGIHRSETRLVSFSKALKTGAPVAEVNKSLEISDKALGFVESKLKKGSNKL